MGWIIAIVVNVFLIIAVAVIAYRAGVNSGIDFCEEYTERYAQEVKAANAEIKKELEELYLISQQIELQFTEGNSDTLKRSDGK